MTEAIDELRARFDAEEQACRDAQRRIDSGGVIGMLVGRVQKWIHTGELQQVTDDLDVAELRMRLSKEPTATA